MHWADRVYSSLANRHLFFRQGWGNHEVVEHLLGRRPRDLIDGRVSAIRRLRWSRLRSARGYDFRYGAFRSPYRFVLNRGRSQKVYRLPPESRTVSMLQVFPPGSAARENTHLPLVLHFAATGDEGFARRRKFLAEPLARRGISSIILEYPGYGRRRVAGRNQSDPQRVLELLRNTRAAMDEGLALLSVLSRVHAGPLGLTGISMGGHLALAAAVRFRRQLAVCACMPSHGAAPVFVEGVLSASCDWNSLQRDFPDSPRCRRRPNARALLRDLLDISDLRNYPAPRRTARSTILIGALRDGYVPPASVEQIKNLWAGSELRWLDTGHVGGFISHCGEFVQGIVDSFQRLPVASSSA